MVFPLREGGFRDTEDVEMNQTFTIQLDLQTLVVWAIVGLIAGFLASRLTMGHGAGIVGDVIIGVLGAVLGGFLADFFGVHVVVVGQPIISQVIVAFVGAVILLMILRVFGLGGRRREAA